METTENNFNPPNYSRKEKCFDYMNYLWTETRKLFRRCFSGFLEWIKTPCGCKTTTFIIIIGIILMLILIPLSYTYISYDEMGFKKNTLEKTVDTSQVYDNGQYFWGPSYDAVKYPSLYQFASYMGEGKLLIFPDNGLEFGIEVTFQYKLNPETLANLYDRFRNTYNTVILNRAGSTIKNKAPDFSLEKYVEDRENVVWGLFDSLKNELETLDVILDPFKFQLGIIELPEQSKETFLQEAIQLQDNIRETKIQELELVKKNTTQLVEEVVAEIEFIKDSNKAKRNKIVEDARSEKFQIETNADTEGLQIMFEELNMTDPYLKQRIRRLLALENSNNGKVIVGGEGSNFLFNI